MIVENGIVKPRSNKMVKFYKQTKENSENAWEDVWNFINKLDIPLEIEDYKLETGYYPIEVNNFMHYLEEKYPYQNCVFESLFDGVTTYEFVDYLEYKYNKEMKISEETQLFIQTGWY